MILCLGDSNESNETPLAQIELDYYTRNMEEILDLTNNNYRAMKHSNHSIRELNPLILYAMSSLPPVVLSWNLVGRRLDTKFYINKTRNQRFQSSSRSNSINIAPNSIRSKRYRCEIDQMSPKDTRIK